MLRPQSLESRHGCNRSSSKRPPLHDVYETEGALFFDDKSDDVIRDDVFERLLTFPNVLVTGHQAFFTEDAMTAIAETTIADVDAFAKTGKPLHEVS